MEADEPLPPARTLLPTSTQTSQGPHQFGLPVNMPSQRQNRQTASIPATAPSAAIPQQAATPSATVPQQTATLSATAVQPQAPVYNSPLPIPVPRSTTYYRQKRAAETQSSQNEEKRTRKYDRKTAFNVCKHCHMPKTKSFGHSRHIGDLGLETYCPAVEGRQYPNAEAWLKARREANPKKKKKGK